MSGSFGISHIVDYLKQMGIKITHTDHERNFLELTFHSDHGQWRMIVGIQQEGDTSKLMLIAPRVGTVTAKKRLECLEALMAVNYRIAIGKFGLDLDDGEVRLEETIPLADHMLTLEQFRLAFGAIMQTVSIYHSLLARIVYSNVSVQDALRACEQEFFRDGEREDSVDDLAYRPYLSDALSVTRQHESDTSIDLDVNDVLAEVARIFGDRTE